MSFSSSYALGLVFILLVSIIWAAASVLVQYLYSEECSFDSPFLLTYIGVSLFTLLLPLQWLLKKIGKKRRREQADYETIETPASTPSPSSPRMEWTTMDHVKAAAKIAPVWFLANYTYGASLRYTSITSSTVLASTGSLFTFLFALLLGDEHFSVYKFVGVLLGIGGSTLTAFHDIEGAGDSDDQGLNNNRILGDALGLLSAVGYGVYAVMVRVLCPHDESLMSMQMFLGFVGLWNLVVLSPFAIYQFVGDGTLTAFVLGFLVIKGLLDNVLSDYLWARAVILTSATVATVGLGLTIPLAFASDVVMGRSDVVDLYSIAGALAVLGGFVLVNIGQGEEENAHEEASDDENGIREDVPLEPRVAQEPLSMECLDAQGFEDEPA